MIKSGIFGIIGKPNMGKSTLINSFIKKKINTVSNKKFTTQNYNISILNDLNNQFIFIDTPGIEFNNYKIKNKYKLLINIIFKKTNTIIYLLDIKGFNIYDKIILNSLNFKKNIILIINKLDLLKNNNFKLNLYKNKIIKKFKKILFTSALSIKNIELLKKNLLKYLKYNRFYFKKNFFINKNFNKIFLNILREKLFKLLNKEIPYKINFIIEKILYNKKKYKIFLYIFFLKEIYKKILISKNFNKIKKIIILLQYNLRKIFNKFFLIYIKFKSYTRVTQ